MLLYPRVWRLTKANITANDAIANDKDEGDDQMSKPITDRAEVGIDFPDKTFWGSFGRDSRYDVGVDQEGVHIALSRAHGEKRSVGFHMHYFMLADILADMAAGLEAADPLDEPHRETLQDAATALRHALRKNR